MTDPMELVGRLERNSKQTITRYCGDLSGAIVPHDLLTEAAACIREMVEKREGLEEDLYQAVLVAYRRGAVEWTRLNYPKWFGWIKDGRACLPSAPNQAKEN